MKKRPFVLLELFIAITLVAFFSLSLVRGHVFYVKMETNKLLKLEQERKAEELFYQVCKNLIKKHPSLNEITSSYEKEIHSLDAKKITFDLGKLKKHTYYWHYHLYSHISDNKLCRKLFCNICFSKDPKVDCKKPKKFADADYGFILTMQKQSKT